VTSRPPAVLGGRLDQSVRLAGLARPGDRLTACGAVGEETPADAHHRTAPARAGAVRR
jgi:hypothetical protein